MSKEADKRILALVKPEYMEKIPAFIRGHATGNSCRLIEKEHPDLYAAFEAGDAGDGVEGAVISDDAVQQMSALINGIFEERMKKHHML